ncbi:SDR family oxidoreductase [Hyphomonas sp. FCG-A18]|uniref:SDR family oxidoreductase n=1 Tax=Hyphomonas sp. FCG-A18 TaxID=3080019 RepID=UPI002B2FC21F|nr:SDR family oxidoreductase [Hyphomonas sp. FCG-A18]
MIKPLDGKVAIVTGAGRGIGRAHAISLAAQGAKVVVNDLGSSLDGSDEESAPADDVVDTIIASGGEAIANYGSVATQEGAEGTVTSALDAFGQLDILVNNAGNYRPRMIFNMSFQDWDSVVRVHLYGHFNCIAAASKVFRVQRSGRIINTASEAWLGEAAVSNYGAAKAGIVGLTRIVARDLGKYGVTCNCICPRASTRMTDSLSFGESAERAELDNELSSLDPSDITPLMVYLASDQASNVNGRVFLAYGGTISLFSEPQPERTLYKTDAWSVAEAFDAIPKSLTGDLINPVPAQPLKTNA